MVSLSPRVIGSNRKTLSGWHALLRHKRPIGQRRKVEVIQMNLFHIEGDNTEISD
jgi:hypothetical protein